VKECDYCGRDNADDAVYCRECGTEQFKGESPEMAARASIGECIRNWATVLDELASCKEVLISWIMAAWIVQVWLRLVTQSFAQAPFFAGARTRWWQDVAAPLFVGATFLLAPVIGTYCLVRWLRQGKRNTLLNLMAWTLLAFFVAIFCFVWIALWSIGTGGWFRP
jgi:hypothetical protein